MLKNIKLFANHSLYESAKDNIDTPNISACINERHMHYNLIPTVILNFTLSEPSTERISVKGDLSLFGGPDNVDGLSNVESILIDGVSININNDLTIQEIIPNSGVNAYYYQFSSSGLHTIKYVLKNSHTGSCLCASLGEGVAWIPNSGPIRLPSKILNLDITTHGVTDADLCCFTFSKINEINFNNEIVNLNNNSFFGTNINNIINYNSLELIGASAFAVSTIKSLDLIKTRVYSIGSSAFAESRLERITLSLFMNKIENSTFAQSALKSIDIDDNILSIGDGAFLECYDLEKVFVTLGPTTVGDRAFAYCSNLTHISWGNPIPPTLGEDVFYDTNNCPIYVFSDTFNTYKTADGWSDYASRIQAISLN